MLIKQFTELTRLRPKTIRCYEEIGLLPPARRIENGYRDYKEANEWNLKLSPELI